MKVSIIIPTYNRNEILCETVSNILQYENQYHELIIVDQTKEHEPHTKLYLDELSNNKKIKYIYVDFPNLPNARNVGIDNSSGDIILFLDDDVKINEDTILSHISGFSYKNIGCVTGKVTVINLNKNQNVVFGNASKIKTKIKFLLFLILRKKASYAGRLGILSDFSQNKILPADTCIGCNMSYKREVFVKCGQFDPNYAGNAIREDTDMSLRLRKKGYKIIYIPDAGLIHYMDNSGGTRTSLNENYWRAFFRNQCYFYIKNFNYSYLYIFFIQLFDILRCRKSGISSYPLFKKSYKDAKFLLEKTFG